ncbi:MAG: CYTH domain-containing protein [Chloroflexi bacterium]|nr:CYTH domain-containing protein [Chloroflexota bacterium]
MRKESQQTSDSPPPNEAEIALVVCSHNPEAIVKEIAVVRELNSFRFVPRESNEIRDTYMDTPAGDLRARAIALRIREVNGAPWITLKGPSKPTDWGGTERLEVEDKWSQAALSKAVDQLVGQGVRLGNGAAKSDLGSPLEVMENMGLKVLQERRTHRYIRDVLNRNSQLLAELAIDSVDYCFGGRCATLHEIEIEAKSGARGKTLKALIDDLVRNFPALRAWEHNKLITGIAIEEMMSRDEFDGLVDSSGNLKPEAYESIDEWLRQHDLLV